MFLIGEFSKLTQVTIRMLRYYDETGLLKPAEVDSLTGYRMYSADQIPVLNKIIYLRDSGFQVSDIAAAINKDSSDFILQQLDSKRIEIEKNIRAEQEQLTKIELAKNELLSGKNDMHYQISIKSVPSYPVLSLRKIIPDYYAEGELWKELSAFSMQQEIPVSVQTFSIYHDPEYKEKDVDVELCAILKEQPHHDTIERKIGFSLRKTEPVPSMACTMVYGSFTNIAGVFLTFAGWLQEHSNYKMGKHSRQIVHRGPWNEDDTDKYLTEIQIPLDEQQIHTK